jgi:hypothetical protein
MSDMKPTPEVLALWAQLRAFERLAGPSAQDLRRVAKNLQDCATAMENIANFAKFMADASGAPEVAAANPPALSVVPKQP